MAIHKLPLICPTCGTTYDIARSDVVVGGWFTCPACHRVSAPISGEDAINLLESWDEIDAAHAKLLRARGEQP